MRRCHPQLSGRPGHLRLPAAAAPAATVAQLQAVEGQRHAPQQEARKSGDTSLSDDPEDTDDTDDSDKDATSTA
jgi:hypothetical protein